MQVSHTEINGLHASMKLHRKVKTKHNILYFADSKEEHLPYLLQVETDDPE